MTRLVAFVLTLATLAAPARAAETHDLDFELKLDVPLLAVGLAGAFVPELGKSAWAPENCRWCHRTDAGSVDINAFDRGVRNGFAGLGGVQPVTWAKTSDLFAYGLLPLGAMVLDLVYTWDGRPNTEWGTDIGVVAQSVFLAAALNQAVKFAAGRQRPFVAYDAPYAGSLRRSNETSADDNLSFFSGHATAAASVTVGMARTIELRTGSRIGYWLLVPLGIATGLMRLAADKHWGTDVAVGLAVGAAAGWLVPTLHAHTDETP